MRTIPVIGSKVILYNWIDRENESRVNVCAQLPSEEWDGVLLNVIDWKINEGTVLLRYQTRNGDYAPIFDTEFPVVTEVNKIARPNKSKNWKLDEYQDVWRNQKTGKRVYL